MYNFFEGYNTPHKYYLFATGVNLKPRRFDTRIAAESFMNEYCAKHGIKVECTERDRHEAKFSSHRGERFYINRI